MLERGIPANRFKLGNNDFPCNSLLEVQQHICDTLTAVRQPGQPATGQALLAMPNPTAGLFYVKIPGGVPPYSLSLSDAVGRVLHQQALGGEGEPADVQGLPAGLYFVRVRDGSGLLWAGRLVKH